MIEVFDQLSEGQIVTQRSSNFLDLILKPLCKQVDSFIKDDMDFLRYIPKTTKQH